jgi:hypothetical protein
VVLKRRDNFTSAENFPSTDFVTLHPEKIYFIRRFFLRAILLYGCETWSLTLREEHRLRVFENRVLRRIFGPKREEGKSRDSSVGIVLGYGLDDRGSRVRFPAGPGNFSFTTVSRTTLRPTQSRIQWVPGALSLGVKRPGCEADHSPHLVPRSKNEWSYASTLPIRLHGEVLS